MRHYRGRLFWKIFIGFWIVFVIISQLIWLGFSLSGKRHEPPELVAVRRVAELQLTSAATVLAQNGPEALDAMLSGWDKRDRQFFHIAPQAQPSPAQANLQGETHKPAESERWVRGADGKGYQLRYDLAGMRKESRMNSMPRRFLNIPEPMFVFAGCDPSEMAQGS